MDHVDQPATSLVSLDGGPLLLLELGHSGRQLFDCGLLLLGVYQGWNQWGGDKGLVVSTVRINSLYC